MSNEPGQPGACVIAIDTGGTFTDIVALVDGVMHIVKVPSTPDDPARAVLDGIAVTRPGATPFQLIHGSTVATNALLERRGARVALVTNAGFEDILEIGRQNRPQLYALSGHRPPPLVPQDRRHGVRGRIGPQGEEIEPADPAELAALAGRVEGADAVAICMLHSYANAAHERAAAQALAALGLPLSISSELLPEFREYERTATTVVNAYVAPVMDRYLGRLAADSDAARIRIMGSGGGAFAVARARREPVHTILSGPAGGVAGALAIARRTGFDRIITFDMGGTSTDVSLCPGHPLHTREFSIAGLPVAVPVLDIHTVGAGGGSLADIDAGGALRVGPASAGAVPGPICYGRGGERVTVTDANVWLGRLPAAGWQHALGGEHAGLDRQAIGGPLGLLAEALGTDRDAAAEGVVAVVNATMERALRVISVERGHDPADFTLVPFGGAAGLHAVALAERLGIPRLLVPPDPGVLSAFGMLVAPIRKEAARSVLRTEAEIGETLDGLFAGLETAALEAMAEEGVPATDVQLRRRVDARYRGQSFELTVPAQGWVGAFHRAHAERYGWQRTDASVEAVTLRVEALAAGVSPVRRARTHAGDPAQPATHTTVRHRGGAVSATCLARVALVPGQRIAGPAVVLEYSSTTWLPPEWTAEVCEDGSLLCVRAGEPVRERTG